MCVFCENVMYTYGYSRASAIGPGLRNKLERTIWYCSLPTAPDPTAIPLTSPILKSSIAFRRHGRIKQRMSGCSVGYRNWTIGPLTPRRINHLPVFLPFSLCESCFPRLKDISIARSTTSSLRTSQQERKKKIVLVGREKRVALRLAVLVPPPPSFSLCDEA